MKIVLGLAGEIASGKGTVSAYLKERHGGSVQRFSTPLRDVAKRMHLEENRENLQKISTIFRENFDDNILSRVILEDIKNDRSEMIAIDGVRRLADINYLKNLPGFKLVYLEAELDRRYQRILKRRENSDEAEKTYEEFKADHEREAELQVRDLKNYANFVIDNNGTFQELYFQVDKLVEELLK